MRPRVTSTFELPDGGTGHRGLSDDIPTFHRRLFGRLGERMEEGDADRILIPGVNAYNQGDYETALSYFKSAVGRAPSVEEDLYPHFTICHRVIAVVLDEHDREYVARRDSPWNRLVSLLRLSGLPWKIRCKYCGHYTNYIEPMAPAYVNKCERCERTYATPDFVWDSIDGQAYNYYRRSVPEEEFYRDFEEMFTVVDRLEE
jgi:hypothetical protein